MHIKNNKMHTSIWYYQSLTVYNQCLGHAAWLSGAANDLSTHHSKTAAQLHYRETIGRIDCHPIVRLSADTIVRWDYRPNPSVHMCLICAVLSSSLVCLCPQATIGRKFAHMFLCFIFVQFQPMFDYRYVLGLSQSVAILSNSFPFFDDITF